MTTQHPSAPFAEQRALDQDLLERAAVFLRREDWGTLRVSGPDRATWLNGIVTPDVATVVPGKGAWGLLLTKQGKIEAELQLVATSDALLLGVSGGDVEHVAEVLDRYLVMEDAELEVLEGFVWWELHGQRAAELAAEAPCLAWGAVPWTRLGGATLVAPGSEAEACELALESRGALRTEPTLWEEDRIRLGVPRFGVDYTSADNPHAAGLERRTVSWSKGCYLGQEVVCMQDMRGKVKRRLVRLELENRPAAAIEPGAEVHAADGGEVVGTVKSWGGRFALASIKAPSYEPGTRVLLTKTPARVRSLELDEAGDEVG